MAAKDKREMMRGAVSRKGGLNGDNDSNPPLMVEKIEDLNSLQKQQLPSESSASPPAPLGEKELTAKEDPAMSLSDSSQNISPAEFLSTYVLTALAKSCRPSKDMRYVKDEAADDNGLANIDMNNYTYLANIERTISYLSSSDMAHEFFVKLGVLCQYKYFDNIKNTKELKSHFRQILKADGFILSGRGLRVVLPPEKEGEVSGTYEARKAKLEERVEARLTKANQEQRPKISKLDFYFLVQWFPADDDDKRLCSELKDRGIRVDDQLGMVLTGVRVERFKKPPPGKLKIRIDGSDQKSGEKEKNRIDESKESRKKRFGYAIWDADHIVDFGGGEIRAEYCKDTHDMEITAGCLAIKEVCNMIETGELQKISKHFNQGTTAFIIEFDRFDAVTAFKEEKVLEKVNAPEKHELQNELEDTISKMKKAMGKAATGNYNYSFVLVAREANRLPDCIANEYIKNPKIRKEDLKNNSDEFKNILEEEENGKCKIHLPKAKRKNVKGLTD